jgi:long-subunit acyl-CoA synthetase (AMP-forming)
MDENRFCSLKNFINENFKKYGNNNFYGYIGETSIPERKDFTFTRHGKVKIKKEFGIEYKWKKYNEVYKDVELISNLFFPIIKSDNNEYPLIGIFSDNNYYIILLLFSSFIMKEFNILLMYNIQIDKNNLKKILIESSLKVICISENQFKILKEILDINKNEIKIEKVILFDNNNFSVNTIDEIKGITIINFSSFLLEEKNIEKKDEKINKNINLNDFKFYSLTSNEYKICEFSEKSILNTIKDLLTFQCFKFTEFDIYYLYNSLGDITEIMFILLLIEGGSKFTFNTHFSKFFDEIELLHPTILNNYPIVWKKIYSSIIYIISQLKGNKKTMAEKAIKIRMNEKEKNENNSNLNEQERNEHNIWDKLIFNKIKIKFGGKVKILFSSSNIINNTIKNFFEISLKSPMISIYGTTETLGFISLNNESNSSLGIFLPSRNIKILKNNIQYFTIPSINNNSHLNIEINGECIVMSDNIFNKYINDFCNRSLFISNDYIVKGTYENGKEDYFFIDKNENIINFKNKTIFISPLKFELDNISDYNGTINNLFESFNIEKEEIVLIGQLNHNLNWENPEEESEKLKNIILNDINNKNNNNIIKNIFLLKQSQNFFDSKLKIRRKLLIKEISKKNKKI